MDANRKAKLERQAIAGLLVVFGLTFLKTLYDMGIIGRRTVSENVSQTPQVHAGFKALPEIIKERDGQFDLEKLDPRPPQGDLLLAKTPGPKPAMYTAHELRNPLESLLPGDSIIEPAVEYMPEYSEDSPEVQFPALMVQGVWWGETGLMAIINDGVYGVGDNVDGVTITGIDRRGVMVEFQGVAKRLTIAGAGSELF